MNDQGFDLRSILGLLRRQARLIAITVLAVLVVATAAVFTMKPIYTASTLVLVDPSRKDLLDPNAQLGGGSGESARVDSEVELAKSEATLLQTIEDENLIDDSEFGVRLGWRDSVLGFFRIAEPKLPTGDEALQSVMAKLRESVTVQRRGLTFMLAIQARSPDPATAARIANAVAAAYIKVQLDAKIRSTLASRDIIQSRIAGASTAVSQSEGAFDKFIEDNIDKITAETGRTDLAGLRTQLKEIGANRARDAAMADLVQRSLEQRDWAAVSANLGSQAVTALAAQRAALVNSLADTVADSQQSIDLRAEVAKLDTQLESSTTEELTTMRQRVATYQSQATDVRTQLRTNILSTDLPPEVLTNIYELQQNAEIARTQYQTLLSRLRELEAQAYLQVADSRVVSQTLPPSEPSFPNPRQILTLAGLAALGLGIGLAFLRENFVGGFTSEAQLHSFLRAPVISAVPRQKEVRSGAGEGGIGEYMVSSPLSIFAESVRRIRVGIDQALQRGQAGRPASEDGGIVIMVTSASPSEGKSTLALSITRAYALAGHKTLLIDCDMRKPSIHRQLNLEPSSGLLEYLTHAVQEDALPSIMTVDDESGAQVVLGARRSDIATDSLLSSTTFARLISAARTTFDIVVLDTPPVGPVVDGLYLAKHADSIVFVVRWASTSQHDVRHAVSLLQGAKKPEAEILSVLNQQEISKSAYSGKYAGYYSAS
jgi:capsular exopolysaccharide synthesis family protein